VVSVLLDEDEREDAASSFALVRALVFV